MNKIKLHFRRDPAWTNFKCIEEPHLFICTDGLRRFGLHRLALGFTAELAPQEAEPVGKGRFEFTFDPSWALWASGGVMIDFTIPTSRFLVRNSYPSSDGRRRVWVKLTETFPDTVESLP